MIATNRIPAFRLCKQMMTKNVMNISEKYNQESKHRRRNFSQNIEQAISDVVLQGMLRLCIPVKKDFLRPFRLCKMQFSSVEIARRSEIQHVIRMAEARRTEHIQNERQTNPILAVFAAPGGGKSRFLDLIADAVLSKDDRTPSCLRGSVVLPISYNGVMSTASLVDKSFGTPHDFGLAVRILWSHFAAYGAKPAQFNKFFHHMQMAVPHLDHHDAVEAVMEHQKTDRVLLLVDELIKSEDVAVEWPFLIISSIGELLDTYPGFNALVTSLKPSPILRQSSSLGRPVRWVPLAPFTLQESLMVMKPILEKYAHLGKGKVLKMLVSDVGGHPRGLQVLKVALETHLKPDMENAQIVEAVVYEFASVHSSFGPLTLEVVRAALRGKLLRLNEEVSGVTVEQLTSSGVFLTSEVGILTKPYIVPRLSIMLLRVFCATMEKTDADLVNCITNTALKNDPRFDWEDMEIFHAHCEVLTRLVGNAGQMSLADFYARAGPISAPKMTQAVSIEFCRKTDGVIHRQDTKSIFHGFTDLPSCKAVYMARSKQAGFDMVTFERKTEEGYVAIFIDTKYSVPDSTTSLETNVPRAKWAHCLAWRENSEAARILGIGPEDCFLVIASWRSGNVKAIQAREAADNNSHILVLGPTELTRFYSPTLVSRPHLITGWNRVLVEGPGPADHTDVSQIAA